MTQHLHGAPPARLSVDDPGYGSRIGRYVEVLLDGHVIGGVISYDRRRGVVVTVICDDAGRFVLTPDGTRVARQERRGVVSARWVWRNDE